MAPARSHASTCSFNVRRRYNTTERRLNPAHLPGCVLGPLTLSQRGGVAPFSPGIVPPLALLFQTVSDRLARLLRTSAGTLGHVPGTNPYCFSVSGWLGCVRVCVGGQGSNWPNVSKSPHERAQSWGKKKSTFSCFDVVCERFLIRWAPPGEISALPVDPRSFVVTSLALLIAVIIAPANLSKAPCSTSEFIGTPRIT